MKRFYWFLIGLIFAVAISATAAVKYGSIIVSGLKLTTSAGVNKVAHSDASGNMSWSKIVTDDITDGNVTVAKLATHIHALSSRIVDFTSPSGTSEYQVQTTDSSGVYIDADIVATGRPVLIMLRSGSDGSSSGGARVQAAGNDGLVIFKRGTSTLTKIYVNGGAEYPSGCFSYIDFNAVAGTSYTYRLYVQNIATGTIQIRDMYFVVSEL